VLYQNNYGGLRDADIDPRQYEIKSLKNVDKGMIFNRLSLDRKPTDRLTTGTALICMMTAEDIAYIDALGNRQSDDSIGFEWNVYFKYMLWCGATWNLQ
jgi:hypothetical protein